MSFLQYQKLQRLPLCINRVPSGTSGVYALIGLTENIRKNLQKGNIGSCNFVHLQKTFDIVELDILLSKLEHYSVHVLAN